MRSLLAATLRIRPCYERQWVRTGFRSLRRLTASPAGQECRAVRWQPPVAAGRTHDVGTPARIPPGPVLARRINAKDEIGLVGGRHDALVVGIIPQSADVVDWELRGLPGLALILAIGDAQAATEPEATGCVDCNIADATPARGKRDGMPGCALVLRQVERRGAIGHHCTALGRDIPEGRGAAGIEAGLLCQTKPPSWLR